jgi:alpha-tubulin suppressor-like RCC1 family protein
MPRIHPGALLLAILATAACEQPVEPDEIPVPQPATVRVEPDSLLVGYTTRRRQLQATVYDAAGSRLPDASVTWSSSDTTVARVSQDGEVTVMQPGTATIEARSGDAVGHIPLAAVHGPTYGDPGEVPGIEEWSAIQVRDHASCGLSADARIHCWGRGLDGQLGRGDDSPSGTPAPVTGSYTFARVAVGAGHSCGLTADGAAYCWGANNHGQLGDGTAEARSVPTAVAGDLRFAEISAGAVHTCAIDAAGAVHCWGLAEHGQLGGPAVDEICIPSYPFYCRKQPQRLQTEHTFASITAGGTSTCALTTGGEAYCWGSGPLGYAERPTTCHFYGRTGGGPSTPRSVECSRDPRLVEGARTYVAVSAGGEHACGVTASGEAYCWGKASFGRLGSGTPVTDTLLPVRVQSGAAFRQISAGTNHTCAVTAADEAFCWGANAAGQVGNAGVFDALEPVPVEDVGPVRSLSAGAFHSCGVGLDGRAHCWGLEDERLGRTP